MSASRQAIHAQTLHACQPPTSASLLKPRAGSCTRITVAAMHSSSHPPQMPAMHTHMQLPPCARRESVPDQDYTKRLLVLGTPPPLRAHTHTHMRPRLSRAASLSWTKTTPSGS
eukprot:349682-Chlamydomonas_euryale.AAC.14